MLHLTSLKVKSSDVGTHDAISSKIGFFYGYEQLSFKVSEPTYWIIQTLLQIIDWFQDLLHSYFSPARLDQLWLFNNH